MSGIYIPGMEMPKNCNECRFIEGDTMDGLCHAANRWLDDDEHWTWYAYPEGDIDTSKPANCPLVPVPDHGRLIDADMLMESDLGGEPYKSVIRRVLMQAPTIIPEEEGE